ncbi:CsgG/HfaB family protein [Sansalvadorimonas sp. 2012CJ34-2]|uniref:CsgG/HfaB family protein n=1 Tax=Parendozoicomonas callyspongiae TaxID=2942213 RepID=A0ABT0PIT1_9GAMM|nr:CsgG/HfaB family protein [Sansalvadorimonas sp. 2012CJ34-2]MCL6271270.1 CsgG/HfaB family protein [Sansalvadorimonas sp. 2012CJ34-2]
MMKRLTAAVMLLMALPLAAFAAVMDVEVTGYGLTEDAAIEHGLTQAIRQVNGADISSVQNTVKIQTKVNDQKDTVSAVSRGTVVGTKGQIAGYSILDRNCSDDECSISMSVQVFQYKTPGLSAESRRKIAVLPFTGAIEFRKMVTKGVQDQLVQSRRFAVLDREHEKEYQAEKSLWQSEDAAISEKARMGKVLGLDYILVGTIEKARANRWITTVELTGEQEQHVRATATVRYQIIAVATRQVKWADTVSVTLKTDSLQKTADAISKKITAEALGNIYPMRVVGMNGDQVILNQGGKTLNTGDVYHIYALGEKIVDPYTKEVLGRDETPIARVRIARVTAKMSYADVIKGDVEDIQKLYIARRYKPKASPKPKKAAAPAKEQKLPEAGGVFL